MGQGIRGVLDRHPDDRVLVHTVSYKLAGAVVGELADADRPVYTYTSGSERDVAVAQYRATPRAVLVASSLERGIDLADDDCRVQVVAKVPFPCLGDRQISARLNGPGGQGWYNTQTVRTIVQMCGRGVRHSEDHASTYILDAGFLKVLKRNRSLFPEWWLEAVDTRSVLPKALLKESQL